MRLQFGLNDALPNVVAAAWGARLIWPNDLVWNRQDEFGDTAHLQELRNWLDKGPLRDVLARLRQPERQYGLRMDSEEQVVLWEDAAGKIVGNPNGSHGYLHIAAWLKRHEGVSPGA